MKRRSLQWIKVIREFSVGGEVFVFRPLHSREIPAMPRFLKRNYPDLKNSYYAHYLDREFYRTQVALFDRWASHCKSRLVLANIVVHKSSGKIAAVMAGSRERHLPLMLSHVGAVDKPYRNSNMFQLTFNLHLRMCVASGIEHGICIADGRTAAAQQAYLNAGFSVCGIVPGGDLWRDHEGREYFVPDVYFYAMLSTSSRKLIPERELDMVPEVKKLWKQIKKPSRR